MHTRNTYMALYYHFSHSSTIRNIFAAAERVSRMASGLQKYCFPGDFEKLEKWLLKLYMQ